MSSSPHHSGTIPNLRLPPLYPDDRHLHSRSTTKSNHDLPSVRHMFPDIDFSQSVHLDSTSLLGWHPDMRVPRSLAGDEHGLTSLPPQTGEVLDHLPRAQDMDPRKWQPPSLTKSSPTPNLLLTSVTPSDSSGAPGCSFDVLRPNRYSASLEHIASSQTQWRSIPRFIDATSTGMAPALGHKLCLHVDTTHTASEQNHIDHLPKFDRRHWLWHGNSSSARQTNTLSRFGHVPSAQIRAAQAQADFEAEVSGSGSKPSRNRRHSIQDLASLSIRDGPSSSSAPEIWSPTDSDSAIPHIQADSPESSNDEVTSPTGAKNKRRCDIERNHICPRCGRAFNRPSSLRMHGRTHTGFRPFVCPVEWCARTFTVSSNMRRHCRKHLSSDVAGFPEGGLGPRSFH